MQGTGSKAGSICQEWMWPLPHSVGMVQQFIPAAAFSTFRNQGDKGGNHWQARLRKTAPGCTKSFLPIRQGKNGSQFQTGAAGSICVSRFPWTVVEPHDYGNGADDNWGFGPGAAAEMLREFQLVSLLFGRVCDVRRAKWFTFTENQIRRREWWIWALRKLRLNAEFHGVEL